MASSERDTALSPFSSSTYSERSENHLSKVVPKLASTSRWFLSVMS